MVRPRKGLFKPLPKSYLPLIADAILAWAEYEAEINAFIGLSHQDPKSPIFQSMIEAPYKRRLEIFRNAFADTYTAAALQKLNGLMGQIKPFKDQRDALAHGTYWKIPYGKRKAQVSMWRWYSDRHSFETEEFSKGDLVKLASGIRREHQKLRGLLGKSFDLVTSPGRKPRKQP